MARKKPQSRKKKPAAKKGGSAKKKTPARAAAAKAKPRKRAAPRKKPPPAKAARGKMPAKVRKPAPRKRPAPVLRLDLDVYNESTGVVFTSLAVCGTIDTEPSWLEAVRTGDLLPVELVQDDPVLVRVVLGPLSREEEEQWVGRIVHRLRLADGKLVVSGGREIITDGLNDFWAQYAHVIDVPPGDYRATLLATAHGIDGRPLLELADAPPAGRWWRETHPGAAPPAWVQNECYAHPSNDPGYEDEWADRPDVDETPLLDFVLQLEPLAGAAPPAPQLESGFCSFNSWEVRVPNRCPPGLAARDPRSIEKPQPATSEPVFEVVDVAARTEGLVPVPIEGGPVRLSLKHLEDLFRLAYLADAAAAFTFRFELPGGASAPPLAPREFVSVRIDGGAVEVGHAEGPRWFALREAGHLGKTLAAADVPDGARFELRAAPQATERGHVWSGEIRGGSMHVVESAPPVDAVTLRDALALSHAVGEGGPLRASPEEAVVVFSDPDTKLMIGGSLEVVDGMLRWKDESPSDAHFVAAPLLRARFGHVWNCAPPAEDEDDDEADASFQEAVKNLEQKIVARTLTGERIFEGVAGNYRRCNLLEQRPLEDELVAQSVRQMRAAGFEVVGDLACSRFGDVIIRGYAREDGGGDTWGVYLAGVLESRFELVTEFVSGAWLTTGLRPAEDDVEKRLYRVGCPDLNFRKLGLLAARHDARRAELGLGPAMPTPLDLVALARAIDRSLCRQLGL